MLPRGVYNMQFIKTANGKSVLKIKRSEWLKIGRDMGWIKNAQTNSNKCEHCGESGLQWSSDCSSWICNNCDYHQGGRSCQVHGWAVPEPAEDLGEIR